ncbi:aminoglycoside phosphotransferase family protein [Microbacterium sp. ZW T5_45]|uniref:aminoglycoside phosphotransferase family protein n=1 Tax=Microbacterium sp. ZW T5_45 TaxID=3378080 RepID=UPI0038544477
MAVSPAAEHDLDASGVRELLRAEAPQFADLSLVPVAEGWDNRIWRLGENHAVRIPRREVAAPLIRNEQRALPVIAPALRAVGIRTPEPIVSGSPSGVFPWPWSIVPWLDGRAALRDLRSANRSWAPRLATALRVLHRPAPADAPHNPLRGVPLRERDATMRSRLAGVDLPVLRDVWEAGVVAPVTTERVWIHGDLHPGNLLLRRGDLHALIDFGDVSAGDPAYDLASAWLLFDAAGRRSFRQATDERYDSSTWTRARAWAAYLAGVFLAQSDDRPELRALGESTAQELAFA